MNPWERDGSHRTWPIPHRRWTMRHRWYDLTFLHWPVPVAMLRPLIPEPIEIDTYEGEAWIGVIPFWMSFRLRNVPWMPLVTTFAEVNVRTYVRFNGTPGVWFLSLDCSSCVVSSVARAWYGLHYFRARTAVEPGDGAVHYSSERSNADGSARFDAWCRPSGARFRSSPGSLCHFLTERYCLFATNRAGRILRADIHHAPWELQDADADLHTNTMAASHGITLPSAKPIVHFAERTDVLVWSPERLPGRQMRKA